MSTKLSSCLTPAQQELAQTLKLERELKNHPVVRALLKYVEKGSLSRRKRAILESFVQDQMDLGERIEAGKAAGVQFDQGTTPAHIAHRLGVPRSWLLVESAASVLDRVNQDAEQADNYRSWTEAVTELVMELRQGTYGLDW